MPVTPILAGAALWPAYAQDAGTNTTAADKRPILHANATKFGAYDPYGDFGAQNGVETEALFLPWEDVDLTTLTVADNYAMQRNRKLLITIEPWSWNEGWRLSSDELRRKVLAGDYDANVKAISDVVKTLKSPVIIRWGQEMEDKSGRFSWSNWPAQDYISAYKKVAEQFRRDTPTVQIMWSPKGLEGLEKYYPGDNYVDLVGLSVFGLQEYDVRAYGAPKTFTQALQPGYERVMSFKKPIWVAELGYEGDVTYMQPWIQTATAKDAKFPDLKEVVYFNDRDVHAWPFGLGRPNWRVKPAASGN
ncbi:glycosyl hydrolase family 5 [Pararhizobium polonicum]|uniref:Glycosyl hydrolase family 5 n=2 Tax=Pararhizobium polonicum TaxID=1612624 RepID=A0A1C7NTW5_9HYPH|nr:glycosyl hydrolase family 5 [Pararhizobium polonicum]